MMQREPIGDEKALEPGFYWVLPANDPDHTEAWANERQPAHWNGTRWAMLDTEDWEVRWVGPRIYPPSAEPAPEDADDADEDFGPSDPAQRRNTMYRDDGAPFFVAGRVGGWAGLYPAAHIETVARNWPDYRGPVTAQTEAPPPAPSPD